MKHCISFTEISRVKYTELLNAVSIPTAGLKLFSLYLRIMQNMTTEPHLSSWIRINVFVNNLQNKFQK